MKVTIQKSKAEMGAAASDFGSSRIRDAISLRKEASIIVATGASQFEMLGSLKDQALPWQQITGFHLDEYIGIPIEHEASFRKYLWQRFVSQLPLPLKQFHFLDGEGNVLAECERVGRVIQQHPIDVAFVGIGENGHLAFNDPPADFETEAPYLVVDLDEACRQQQLGEGWFPDFDSVPRRAISMSVQQIMKSKTIVCTVPDARKAEAVKKSLHGKVSPEVPASILQTHPDCHFFLDQEAASLL